MQTPSPEFWWAIGIGTVGLLLITFAFLTTLVVGQRRLRNQLDTIRASESKYRNLFDNSLVGMLRISIPEFSVIDCNRTLLEILGVNSRSEVRNFFHQIRGDRLDDLVKRLAHRGILENAELELLKPDGSLFWASVTCRVHSSEGYAEGVLLDITERKRAEVRLKDSHQQLRNLSARLASVREEERIRIARQVHDDLGQILTAVKIHLTVLTEAGAARDAKARATNQKKLESLIGVIDTAINLVKNISYELRPLALEDLGLKEAIEWETTQFGQKCGITCHIQSNGDVALEREQATAVFRILQEALTNIARHASARTVWVRLKNAETHLTLEVADDGRGITEQQVRDSRSLGLLGMRERATFLGGELRISRNNGTGTLVGLIVPLKGNGKTH